MLTESTSQRPLIGLEGSLDEFGVRLVIGVVVGAIVIGALIIAATARRLRPELRAELVRRTASWAVMAPIVVLPVLLGRLPTACLMTLMGLLCYREFARATGLFRDKVMTALVVLAVLLFNAAALDHWPGLFMAMGPLSMVAIAACAILRDQPKGFIQRVGLTTWAALLFGGGLAHASWFAHEPSYRAPLLLLFLAVGLNDVFAYCVGKSIGGRKLSPHTSPRKTLSGALGAVVLTTLLVFALGSAFFRSNLGSAGHLLTMGVLVSVCGILGDLTLSSIKRDVGIKDMGAIIPGHGGVLDRCNSLLLAVPALFHYVKYFHGVGEQEPMRILSGGW
jgi:phosphatidate cytidylyltransferase